MKKAFVASLALIVIVVGGLLLLMARLDLNTYRSDISAAVERLTGHRLEIVGDIDIELALTPKLSIGGLRIANPSWARDEHLLEAKHGTMRLAIPSLLRGSIHIRQLSLDSVALFLEENSDGRGNWQTNSERIDNSTDGDLAWLEIDSLKVKTLKLTYRPDEAPPHVGTLSNMVLSPTSTGGTTVNGVVNINDQQISIEGTVSALKILAANKPFEFAITVKHSDINANLHGSIAKPLEMQGLDFHVSATIEHFAKLLNINNNESTVPVAVNLTGDVISSLDTISFENIHVTSGDSIIDGSAYLSSPTGSPLLKFDVRANPLDLNPLLKMLDGQTTTVHKAFSPASLPMEVLNVIAVKGQFDITQLTVKNFDLMKLHGKILSDTSSFELNDVVASLASGEANLNARLLQTPENQPSAEISVAARKLNLAELPINNGAAIADSGTLSLVYKSRGNGRSIADIMATSNGHININITDARLHNTGTEFATGDLLVTLLNGLNPLSSDNRTHIECATLNFPIKNGIAKNEFGIGIRTAQLSILGGGTIDLRSEEISLQARPKPRQGIGLNLASLADFVSIGGTLTNPTPTTDTKGIATAGVKIGAALATGGLSVLAEGLYDRASSDADVCAIAEGKIPLKSAKNSGANKTNPIDSAGQKIKGAFKSLFGD
ncbi:MAG: AsmA family protein [Gammaproteobacteria bacterium]